MATQYEIKLTMPAATVTELATGNYLLYAFKAANGPPGGVPVVWFSLASPDYSETTNIKWSEQYYAYTATLTDPVAKTVVTAGASCKIDTGKVASVSVGGVITPTGGDSDDPAVIEITNTTLNTFTCGIAMQPDSAPGADFTPTCAFQLEPGNGSNVQIVPIEQVFLMFATPVYDTGYVLEEAYSAGALIDLTTDHQVDVTFDYALGGWQEGVNISLQPASAPLAAMLINAS